MKDRQFSALHVFAGTLWAVGGLLILATLIAHQREGLAELGLLLAGAGGVLSVRGMLCHMEQRERTAFEIGRDIGRLHSIDR